MIAQIDTSRTKPLEHYWEFCIGSCHASTALREDYRQQLRLVHKELGMRYVRFHGLFDDDMSVVLYDSVSPYMPSDKVKYNFRNIDNILDFLISIGMKPFLELGFMPELLSSGRNVTMHYKANITPPASYEQWGDFIGKFAGHLLQRYGKEEVETWFFEVWNEPNLPAFWTGTQKEYFHLYEVTAKALKALDLDIRVGGPATSINAWIPEFRSFCESNHVPLDFISTHHYPTDDPMWNHPDKDLMSLMNDYGMDVMNRYDRHIMRKMTERARKECGNLPLYYTEWSISALMGDVEHDTPYAAAAIARILHENLGLVQGYSWWTFSDIFEEMGQMCGAFQGGFGLLTCDGIRKPSYHAFTLMHQLGEVQYEVQMKEAQEEDPTIGVLASGTQNGTALLVYNQNTRALNQITPQTISLRLPYREGMHASVIRVDEEHGNPRKIWEEDGAPEYLDPKELDRLNTCSALSTESLTMQRVGEWEQVDITMPEYSMALVKIEQR